MEIQKIRQVWQEKAGYLAKEVTPYSFEEAQERLAAFFCPGPFYAYIFDFGTYQFQEIGDHYEAIMGVSVEGLTLDMILSRIHPEDQDFFSRCEQLAGHFLFGVLSPDQILKYKVSYCYRMRTADGTYKLFLHQVMGITLDSNNRLGKVLGVHSDISHLTNHNSKKLSLFGLKGEPSFLNLDVYQGHAIDFTQAVPSTISPRETEVLRLLSEGATAKEAAEVLFISEATVRKHRENLLKKTESKNTAHLITHAIRQGLI